MDMDYETTCGRLRALPCSDDKLKNLKIKYQSVINSKRRLDAIKTLPEFINVLQKRDYINPENVNVLTNFIRENFNDFYQNNHVQNLNNVRVNGYKGVYNAPNERVLDRLPHDPKERAYQLIVTEIGHKWSDFARALHIPEGSIDRLSKTRFNDRIYEILLRHEEQSDPRFWQSDLLDALVEARRRDLSQRVQRIFDMFS